MGGEPAVGGACRARDPVNTQRPSLHQLPQQAQDEINKRHPRNPPMHMMCWMNFWTFVYYAIYLFGMTRWAGGSGVGRTCMQPWLTHMDPVWFATAKLGLWK